MCQKEYFRNNLKTKHYHKHTQAYLASSSGKIDKYRYLTGKEILPPPQGRITEKVTFTYSSLEKPLEKQTKTIQSQGNKLIKST